MSETNERQTGKAYWRSLERWIDSAPPDDLRRELAEGAADPPDAMTRRSMLRLMGASFALAGLAACRRPVHEIVPFVEAPENVVPGAARRYATTMPFGVAAYGLVVEAHEGRPTKIEGNELHPASMGRASAWMQAALLDLYDPDRSSQVLRRAGKDAAPAPSSWEELGAWWQERAAGFERSGGRGLAVLSRSYASPALARLARRFAERFPEARWVVFDPVGDENLLEGVRRATGAPGRLVFHLARARRVVSLDADFLLTETDAVTNARGWAAARRVDGPADDMARLYAVEPTLTLTGANADHRLAVPSRLVPAVAAALCVELARRGIDAGVASGAPPALPGELARRVALMAEDLASAAPRGEAVVLAGRSQPPAVHALTLAMNRGLGAIGSLVTLHPVLDAAWSDPDALAALVASMRAGEVDTLVVLGANPAYEAPADLETAAALSAVPHVVHLGAHVDETAALAEWHLPQAHFLESWGDARATDGTPSIVQPLVRPLFDGRSDLEIAGLLVEDRLGDGYGLVRDAWLEGILGNENAETRWNRALHDGVYPAGAPAPVEPVLSAAALGASFEEAARAGRSGGAGGGLEIVFRPSSAVFDGRFANNGWLQELPDPITKITWDNAALLSPATARRLEVRTGDVVRVELEGRAIELAAFVLPGDADEVVGVALGYGRRAAGRVGTGVGVDAYRLRRSPGLYADAGVTVTKTGRRYVFAQTQEHGEMEGRDHVREATLAEYRARPDFARAGDAEDAVLPLYPERAYAEGHQWAMSIDLNACIGCGACVTACQAENNIPIVGPEQVRRGREMHWLRVDRYFSGEPERPRVVFQPVPCMHCENAPCEEVCPVAATVHDGEGLNVMVYNRCIGTRYCSNNCPYKVRHFNFFNYTKELPETIRMAMNPDVTVRSRGVMEKCTYCVQRLNEAKSRAKAAGRPLADGEVQTACQQTCPADAIVFGDKNDPASRVRAEKEADRSYILLASMGHRPRTSYRARLSNPNPDWGTA